jgi:hypothetical protein
MSSYLLNHSSRLSLSVARGYSVRICYGLDEGLRKYTRRLTAIKQNSRSTHGTILVQKFEIFMKAAKQGSTFIEGISSVKELQCLSIHAITTAGQDDDQSEFRVNNELQRIWKKAVMC